MSASPAAHLRSAKREKPIRLTPTFEQFKAIIADVRAQPFNADAQDSADFLEFLGLAGLGQAEAGSLTPADVDFEAGASLPSGTRRAPALPFRFILRCARCWNGFAKARRMMIACSELRMRKRRLPVLVGA